MTKTKTATTPWKFDSISEAARAAKRGDGLRYFQLNGSIMLAPTLTDARKMLTVGLKEMSKTEVLHAVLAEVQGVDDDPED